MQRLIQDLKSGDFKKIYLLYGQEAYLRKQYKDKLKEAMIGDDTMNFSYYEGKDFTVGEVIDQAETMPFFADRRLILIGWRADGRVSEKPCGKCEFPFCGDRGGQTKQAV